MSLTLETLLARDAEARLGGRPVFDVVAGHAVSGESFSRLNVADRSMKGLRRAPGRAHTEVVRAAELPIGSLLYDGSLMTFVGANELHGFTCHENESIADTPDDVFIRLTKKIFVTLVERLRPRGESNSQVPV